LRDKASHFRASVGSFCEFHENRTHWYGWASRWVVKERLSLYLSALRANDHPRAAPFGFELEMQKRFQI
jgi:hypothetical protein